MNITIKDSNFYLPVIVITGTLYDPVYISVVVMLIRL